MTEQARVSGHHVKLDIFEGPFELLLSLISERRLDVCDVPIATLVNDYLASLERLRELDLEPATEFIVVAATLLQLKARALLPSADGDERDEEETAERDLLIARLLEVRTFQASGDHLVGLLTEGDRRWAPAPASNDPALRQMPTLAGIAPADLGRALVEVVTDRLQRIDTSLLVADEVSTQEAAGELLASLERRATLTFADLANGRGLPWAVALFLAMLELHMRGEIDLGPGERLGEIEIRAADREKQR